MSGDDDLAARMRQLAAEFAEDETFELDDELVSRLLRGDAGAGDTPPEYAEVADVLAAAAVPPRPAELRGEAAVLAAFRAVHDEASMIAPGRPNRLRRSVLTPLAAATATAVVLGSGLAAAAGLLPAPAQRAVHEILGDLGLPAPAPADATRQGASSKPATAPLPTSARTPAPRPPTNPSPPTSRSPADVTAIMPLCAMWEERTKGGDARLDAEQFARLAAAAGGVDKIGAACAHARDTQQRGYGDNATGGGEAADGAEKAKKLGDETEPTQGPPAVRPSKSPTPAKTRRPPNSPAADPTKPKKPEPPTRE
jgi:hypothetical protein